MFETSAAASITTPIDDARAPSVAQMFELFAQADRFNALALLMAASLASSQAIERTTGLTTETALRLIARRTGWDAAELARMGELLGVMPRFAQALTAGDLSFSQARAIARECKGLSHTALERIDVLVGEHATRLAHAEPEELVRRVEDAASAIRAQAALRREERQMRTSFLWLQPRIDGGGALYGEADPEAFATIAQALEHACVRPEGEIPRANQRMDALTGICGSHLSGSSASRARPRFLATVQLKDLECAAEGARTGDGARVLTTLATRPQTLSPLATAVAVCDGEVQIVAFDGAQPVAISRVAERVPTKTRAAVVARDGGCRFPNCAAPAAWADAHHIRWQSAQGSHDPENLVLLCRRCHRRVHGERIRVTPKADGAIEFRVRGRIFASYPRARPPSLE